MDEQDNLNSLVPKLAGVLASPQFPRGDLAALRRMSPESPPLVFWRIMNDYVPENMRGSEARENLWVVLLNGMAIMAPEIHSYDPRYAVGAVFSSFPEQRINHFLRSKGKNLSDQIRLLARLCGSKGIPVDWTTLGYLIFSKNTIQEEKTKRAIAKDYIKAAPKKEESAK